MSVASLLGALTWKEQFDDDEEQTRARVIAKKLRARRRAAEKRAKQKTKPAKVVNHRDGTRTVQVKLSELFLDRGDYPKPPPLKSDPLIRAGKKLKDRLLKTPTPRQQTQIAQDKLSRERKTRGERTGVTFGRALGKTILLSRSSAIKQSNYRQTSGIQQCTGCRFNKDGYCQQHDFYLQNGGTKQTCNEWQRRR